jgi:predicted secreted protein
VLNTSEIQNLEQKTYTTIRLTGLASCGYLWDYVVDRGDIVDISHLYENSDKYDIMGIGSSPDELFKIAGIGLGKVTIKFIQTRPWIDNDMPHATHLVTVTVV